MKMKRKLMACLLVCTMMFQMSVFPVSAETSETDESGYLYRQDFSCTTDDLTLEGWNSNQISGFSLTSDGNLQASKGANARYIFMSGNTEAKNWSDYSFEADVVMTNTVISDTYTSNAKWAGLFIGSQNASITNANNNGYELRLSTTNDEEYTLQLYDFTAAASLLDSSDTISNVSAGDTCRLKLEVSGNYIKGYINGECLVEAEVASVTDITGYIGLRAGGRISSFDNIAVHTTGINYSEDFSCTTADLTEEGWNSNQISGFSLTSDGKLQASSGADTRYVFMNGNTEAKNWSDYSFEADVVMTNTAISDTYTSNTKWAGLFIGSQSANIKTTENNGYELRLTTTDNATYTLQLYDFTAAAKLLDSSDTIPNISADTPCKLKIEISGNYIKGYINGECLVEAEVASVTDITGYIGLRAGGRISSFDNLSVCSLDYHYDVSFYRNGVADTKLQPYKEGCVFGGWYEDMAFKTPLGTEVTTGKAYAKFLDEDVLSVQAQLDSNTKSASDTGKTRLRFVTTVDCLDYEKVGFIVSTLRTDAEGNPVGKSQTFEITTVYEELLAEGLEVPYEPEDISSDSVYFATMILGNLSATTDDLNKVFTVTPFWVTADGTTVNGITRDAENNPITIQNGINANNNNNGSSNPYSLR